MHLERAVLATIDFALTAEHRSCSTPPSCGPNLDRFWPKTTEERSPCFELDDDQHLSRKSSGT